jgi:hypothetical protein
MISETADDHFGYPLTITGLSGACRQLGYPAVTLLVMRLVAVALGATFHFFSLL